MLVGENFHQAVQVIMELVQDLPYEEQEQKLKDIIEELQDEVDLYTYPR